MSDKVLISLFDYTGNASRPYAENGWTFKRVDIKSGIDILLWDYKSFAASCFNKYGPVKFGIIAMIPCTAYALCGNKHKKSEERKEVFEYSQKLVAKTKEIIDYFETRDELIFWQVENPMSDIHTHNKWLGKVQLQFDPCDYAGYDPIPENSRYNKRTWLWGKFRKPDKKRLEPLGKEFPGYEKLGGKSERTKELRSITPLGFCYAFYNANH